MADLTLEVLEGPDAGRTVALADALEIGRDPGADLTLADDLVSRHHARIRIDEGGAVIEDLGSSNGTFVNATEVREPTRLAAGDELLIGASVIALRSATTAAATVPPGLAPGAAPPLAPPPLAVPPDEQPAYAEPEAPPYAPPPEPAYAEPEPPVEETGPVPDPVPPVEEAAPGPEPVPPLGQAAPVPEPEPAQPLDEPPPEPEPVADGGVVADAAPPPSYLGQDPRIGTELAGYRIEALIGRGGMGVVYRAEHLRLGRRVALKLLPPHLAANEGFRERFESESRLAAAIDHPNIIPLYDAGEAEGLLYITMRYVDGLDLKALVEREGPLPLERAVSIIGQVGSALDAAHARGLVHRDVKPANVLVASGAGPEASDHCYLTDFGLTKDTSSTLGLTGTGQFVGTIDYVAPEQIQGITRGGGADQYSLGCVLYECLTGWPPFERKTELDVMWAHLNEDPPSFAGRRGDLPKGMDAVLAKAMAKAPEDRYPTCAAMASAARATLSGSGRRRRGR